MEGDKLSTILDWPYPENLKQLNWFLGFINFYRKFIKGFSDIVAPLMDLTKSEVDVPRNLASAKSICAFQLLKDHFKKAPLLAHFDFSRKQILSVNSLKYALSAVLSQPDAKGVVKPVSFLSKKWNASETSWQVHGQELGEMVQVFVEW
jgi:hypothetical protein